MPRNANAKGASAEASPKLHLVVGDEPLLAERAMWRAIDAARAADPSAELKRMRASELTEPVLAELLSPSLFAEAQIVVLEGAQELRKEIAAAVLGHAGSLDAATVLIVVHSGGGQGKAARDLPAGLRKAGATETTVAKLTKQAEREQFLRAEVREAGGRIQVEAARALIEAVGTDLRELSSAARQLAADTGGDVTEDAVRQYHRGRAEITGFVVADKAVTGEDAAALEALRWALQLGVAPVLIADALADAVRTVGKVGSSPREDPHHLASRWGMPPWKARKALSQARGWNARSLSSALHVVAQLNAEVKGQAADAEYALERAVRSVARLASSSSATTRL